MVVLAFKNPQSSLRRTIKVMKDLYDNIERRLALEPTLKRQLFLEKNEADITWNGEGLHQLALSRESVGDFDSAEKYFQLAIESFEAHELLGMARVKRDYGLYLARHVDPKLGRYEIEQALALHDDDVQNRKGRRQRRITESYLWRVQLLADSEDAEARDKLIEFALSGSRDCCQRDQEQAVAFALPYAGLQQRPLLDARLLEIKAKRRQLPGTIGSATKLIIDTELFILGWTLRKLFRRE